MALEAFVSKRSKLNAGKPLYPHKHKDGMFVASHSRFEVDYIRVETPEQLQALVEVGYGARMSNPALKVAASFVVSKNIRITDSHTVLDELKKSFSALELDLDSTRKRRAEQNFLRAYLLKGKESGQCVICGSTLPENLLIAAHIKKRADCTFEEKLDFNAIAGLMCKLGCDVLFEQGYIYVSERKIFKNPNATTTMYLDKMLSNLKGRSVANWDQSKIYYSWHKEKWVKKIQ
ncbi:HNH endonuclease signature motif containing protein [Brenneria populi subsp. brevivirga]|uniref:HNH endonuclease signature motif containing protein n=1 Tax=Brenneria populi TaxID=1505588 RepID=UPI002E17D28D|nr:HNH endonuclease signature motif containing protein [Brenneria populi subsp. brevivirga]